MNLSNAMIDEIKRVMPREIRLEAGEIEEKPPEIKCDVVNALATIPPNDSLENLSHKQIEKLELVLEIKEKFVQGNPLRQLAREYNLSRATVKKYVKMITPQEGVKYDNSNKRYSQFDKYEDEIVNLCDKLKTVTEIKVKLEECHNEKITYSSLNHYIRKHQLKSKKINPYNQIDPKEKKPQFTKILRGKLIKYIFGWKMKKDELEAIETNLESLVARHDIISLFKQFYLSFKSTLINKDWVSLNRIIKTVYDNKVVSNFVKGLTTDYEAVINSAKFPYSNGCVEGNVNKLKKIKRDMYGRAHINLLRNKVIYQSLYF